MTIGITVVFISGLIKSNMTHDIQSAEQKIEPINTPPEKPISVLTVSWFGPVAYSKSEGG